MGLTIKDMKLGSTLVLGKYGVRNDHPEPIMWLKASDNCDFITMNVIDYLPFDVREPGGDFGSGGNPIYRLSNIHSFLNSESDAWYSPTHAFDAPPNGRTARYGSAYESHCGFLYHFEDYETEQIKSEACIIDGDNVSCQIRLPRYSEVFEREFRLFARRGVRAKPTDDMLSCRHNHGLTQGQFSTFWLCDNKYTYRACYVDRTGSIDRTLPNSPQGIRPVCKINPDTPVVLGDDGMYRIEPRSINHNVYDDDELFALLGMAQP